eukprot:Hpha_TRINITY_DN1641_c0_g1::TRINITY_DN1641_c0_g1_i1::g.48719::m.48719
MAGSPRPALRGVPSWMLSAWPIPDPDDWVDDDATATAADVPARRLVANAVGPPLALGGGAYPASPKSKEKTTEAVALTRRMMPQVADNIQPSLIADCAVRAPLAIQQSGSSVLQQEADARAAFEMFQVLRDRIGYLYAFDLPQAMNACGLEIDEQQEAELKRAFGLNPGDFVTFEQFKHMAEVVRSGSLGSSPPRERSEDPVPGSPEYISDKIPKDKDKGKPAPKRGGGYHKWMATSMGDSGNGVEIPSSVRRKHYNEPVEALENGKPVPVKPAAPALDWSPFENSA